MTATARDRRDRLRAMLADLKMPGALEAVDGVLAKVDSGAVTAGEAIEQVLGAQIALRNNRRLQAAMRSSRLPAVKTLAQLISLPAEHQARADREPARAGIPRPPRERYPARPA